MVEVDTLARKFLLGRMQEWQASSAPYLLHDATTDASDLL
jgi:hypothetical protein